MNWYKKYKNNPGSLGHLLYCLNNVFGISLVEALELKKGGELYYQGELFAIYRYGKDNKVMFDFADLKNQERWDDYYKKGK